MSGPRTDCRECAYYDPPSDPLGSAWCRAHEETVVRVIGRCGAYQGPRGAHELGEAAVASYHAVIPTLAFTRCWIAAKRASEGVMVENQTSWRAPPSGVF